MNFETDNSLHTSAKTTIQKAVSTLSAIQDTTEGKFLKFGQILNGSYSRTRNILSSVKEASTIVASPEIHKSIDDLDEVINNVKDILSVSDTEVNANTSTMQRISNQLQEVLNELGNFNRFVKRLRVLGLSTKIESARINDIDNGFDNLAQNVENLSNGIDEKVKQILQRLNALFNVINKINRNSVDVTKNTRDISGRIMEKAGLGADLLNKKFALAKRNTDEIAMYSGRISEILGDIVQSLQYQDISRQQIDHIIEALEALFDEDVNRNLSREEITGEIYHIVKLQKAQLTNTKSQFLRATEQLVTEVTNVSEMTDNLIRMIRELLNNNENSDDSSLENAREKLKNTIDILTENASGDSELIKMIEQVNEMIEELSDFVQEVEEIGDEIELISLNSQIKAVRLGNDGASLGILAQNIQTLSVNAKEQTNSLSDKFKHIRTDIGSFNDSLTESAQKVGKLSDNSLRARLNNLFTELGDTHTKVFQIVEHADTDIESVKKDSIEADELREFAQASEAEFDLVQESLDSILNNIDPASVAHMKSRSSGDLRNKYTMDSERETHDFIDGDEYDLGNSPDSSDYNSDDDPGEFGDNVELF